MERIQLTMGRKVTANKEFSGVPVGTKGEVVKKPRSWPETDSVAIQWKRHPGDTLIDWFSFDDLEYLDI